jgi:hypothetical protein
MGCDVSCVFGRRVTQHADILRLEEWSSSCLQSWSVAMLPTSRFACISFNMFLQLFQIGVIVYKTAGTAIIALALILPVSRFVALFLAI